MEKYHITVSILFITSPRVVKEIKVKIIRTCTCMLLLFVLSCSVVNLLGDNFAQLFGYLFSCSPCIQMCMK